MPEPAQKSREALWLALAPAFVYAFAFTFEAGYARAFHLPVDLIRLDLERVITVGGSLLIFLSLALFLLRVLPARGTRVVLDTFLLPTVVGYLTWVVITSDLSWWGKVATGLFFLFTLFILVLQPLREHPGSLIDRWEKDADKERKAGYKLHRGSIFTVGLENLAASGVDVRIGLRVYRFLFVGLLVSYYGGKLHGRLQSTFLTSAHAPGVILVRRWGPYFVGLNYDSAANSVGPEYHLLSLEKDQAHTTLVPKRLRGYVVLDSLAGSRGVVQHPEGPPGSGELDFVPSRP